MRGLTLSRIAHVTGGTLYLSVLTKERIFATFDDVTLRKAGPEIRQLYGTLEETEVSMITTDSRKVQEGGLFAAIVGERVDGHSYIAGVFEQKALCVISERALTRKDLISDDLARTSAGTISRAWIEVTDTQTALARIAEEYLKILRIPVVGVTGSVGKTSTKEMIASVLSQKFRTLKTEGNFNNELGVPLTIFRLRDDDEVAVIEMGINHFGEMTRLSKIVRPDIAVITNIGTAHLEFLKSRDGILRAKTEIFEYMKPDGLAVLSGNDDKLTTLDEVKGKDPVFFGVDSDEEGTDMLCAGEKAVYRAPTEEEAYSYDRPRNIYAKNIRPQGFSGSECTMVTPSGSFEVRVPVSGIHQVANAAAATAVGLALNMSLTEIRRGIEAMQTIAGRFRIIETGSMTVIDDCYNANPISMKTSLGVMAGSTGHRVAILGDMGELGDTEKAMHEETGRCAAGCVDKLIAIGRLSKDMYEAALKKRPDMEAVWYESVEEFLKKRDEELESGDIVLVKASHFMEFPKIVAALTSS